MIPKSIWGERYISEKKWKKAIGVMFCILMAEMYDDGWISYQDIYSDILKFFVFSTWFEEYSTAMKTLLGKTDKDKHPLRALY